MSAFLVLENVSFVRPGRTILRHVNLAFDVPEFIGLLGENAAGKSTLLKIMLGLLSPSSGRIWLRGRDLKRYTRREIARCLAYVPQEFRLQFPFTVEEAALLGRLPFSGLRRPYSQEDRDALAAVFSRLDLMKLRHRACTTLSGGERQRVLLARALLQKASALILDEPLTGLDFGHQLRMLSLLQCLRTEGRLIVMTSHRPEELFGRVDRVLILADGAISYDGAPSDVLTARNLTALYGVPLREVEHDNHRFFYPHNENTTCERSLPS